MEKEVTEFAKIESKLDSLPNVFAQYYYTLRAEKKSYRTIGEYLNSIKHFMEFVTNGETHEGFYKKVSATDINRYMLSLETKVVNGKTQPTSSGFKAGRWNAVNSFFAFLVKEGILSESPITPDTRPQYIRHKENTMPLNEHEIRGLMEEIEYSSKDSMESRNLSIFMLAVGTGLKISAIIALNINDIDLNLNSVDYEASTGEKETAIIDCYTANELKKWLNDRQTYFPNVDTPALFVSQQEQRIGYDIIRKMLIQCSERVTYTPVTPQVLTATYKEMGYYVTHIIFKDYFKESN